MILSFEEYVSKKNRVEKTGESGHNVSIGLITNFTKSFTVSIMKYQEKDTAQIWLMFRIKYYHRQGRTGIPIKNKCQKCHERSLFKIIKCTQLMPMI